MKPQASNLHGHQLSGAQGSQFKADRVMACCHEALWLRPMVQPATPNQVYLYCLLNAPLIPVWFLGSKCLLYVFLRYLIAITHGAGQSKRTSQAAVCSGRTYTARSCWEECAGWWSDEQPHFSEHMYSQCNAVLATLLALPSTVTEQAFDDCTSRLQ